MSTSPGAVDRPSRFDPPVPADRLDRGTVLECLDTVVDPCSAATATPMGLTSMGLIRDVRISASGEVDVDLKLTSPACFMVAFMSTEAVERISRLPGVTEVRVHPDEGLDWTPDDIHPVAAAQRRQGLMLMRNAPTSARPEHMTGRQ